MRSKAPVPRDAQTNRKEFEVTNTIGGSRRSRLGLAGLVAAIGTFAALAAFPGGASASSVTCKGKTQLPSKADRTVDNQLEYRFTCNEKIVSYSIIANRSVNYFDPEVEVFIGKPENNNVSPTDSFGCEGPIPGNGIGCKGSASQPDADGPRFVDGSIGLEPNPCARHAKGAGLRTWLVVETQPTDPVKGTPYLISSEPFRLNGPGCGKTQRTHHRLRT
jgi:hypothetical protein